jgi:S1-C subfamily serine protease
MKRLSIVTSSIVIAMLLLSACSFTLPTISKTKPAAGAGSGNAAPAEAATATIVPETSAAQPSTGDGSLASYETMLTGVYERVNPSVVSIDVLSTVKAQSQSFDLPFNFPNMPDNSLPNNNNNGSQDQIQQGAGSGFVWDREGYVVTNNHVVDGAENITVTFADGTSLPAKVVGTDKNSDLAVVKVDKGVLDLQPVELADSNKLKVGNLVMAIGNPFGLEGSYSVGIVSALGRTLAVDQTSTSGSYSIPDIIQTDATINPGNSGGVLVNSKGQVVGVTTAIESPVRASSGVGFAVPSAIIQKVVPALIQDGKYSYTYLGLSGGTLTSDLAKAMDLKETQRGILVNSINPNTPADKAGLVGSSKETKINGLTAKVGGDVITAIDGQELRKFEDLISYLARATVVGQKVKLDIIRDGKAMQVEATLEARPTAEKTTQTQDDTIKGSAYLGVTPADITPEIAKAMGLKDTTKGALILSLDKDGPADKAGLLGGDKPLQINGETVMVGGDIITAMNGKAVESVRDLRDQLLRANPGDEIKITILRGGAEKEITAKLVERPAQ